MFLPFVKGTNNFRDEIIKRVNWDGRKKNKSNKKGCFGSHAPIVPVIVVSVFLALIWGVQSVSPHPQKSSLWQIAKRSSPATSPRLPRAALPEAELSARRHRSRPCSCRGWRVRPRRHLHHRIPQEPGLSRYWAWTLFWRTHMFDLQTSASLQHQVRVIRDLVLTSKQWLKSLIDTSKPMHVANCQSWTHSPGLLS